MTCEVLQQPLSTALAVGGDAFGIVENREIPGLAVHGTRSEVRGLDELFNSLMRHRVVVELTSGA